MLRNVPKGVMRPELVQIVTGSFDQKQKLNLLEQQLKEAKELAPASTELQRAIRQQIQLLLQDCVHTTTVFIALAPSERTFEERRNSLPHCVVPKKYKEETV
jgi:ATP sulfurylase